jgi:hypothetical protein
MKINNYSLTVTGLLLITGLVLTFLLSNKHFTWVKNNESVVKTELYDSLVAIANRPPKDTTIIVHDTIPGEPIIKWKDKLIPVYLDSLSAVYSDTLKTNNFKVVTTDTLQYNRITYRKYNYETYVDTIIRYIEKEKPVLVYKDSLIYQVKRTLYYGAGMYFSKTGFVGMAEITYKTKKDTYFGIGTGVMSYPCSGVINYQPIVGVKIGRKF